MLNSISVSITSLLNDDFKHSVTHHSVSSILENREDIRTKHSREEQPMESSIRYEINTPQTSEDRILLLKKIIFIWKFKLSLLV